MNNLTNLLCNFRLIIYVKKLCLDRIKYREILSLSIIGGMENLTAIKLNIR